MAEMVVVYGVRSRYAAELAEILGRLGQEHVVYVDNTGDGPEPAPVTPIIGAADLPSPSPDVGVVVPMFAPHARAGVVEEVTARGFRHFPVIIDPTAVVASTALLGLGTHVNAGVVIASNTTLGEFVVVNRSVSIGHDNSIADYTSFGPGCVLAGNVVVGHRAVVGAGATVLPGVSIGGSATVGAGSVVTKDVLEGEVVVGNPARPMP